jgi:hypothetical protein
MSQQADTKSAVSLDTAMPRPLWESVQRDSGAVSYSTRIMLSCAALAIIGILGHTLYASFRAGDPPIIPQWTPRPEPEVEPEPVEPTVVLPSLPPVRIRNAFDESEVFEFPAGTSDEDARKSVADILRRRALGRQ